MDRTREYRLNNGSHPLTPPSQISTMNPMTGMNGALAQAYVSLVTPANYQGISYARQTIDPHDNQTYHPPIPTGPQGIIMRGMPITPQTH